MKPRNPHALPARQRKGGAHKVRGRVIPQAAAIEEQLLDDRTDVGADEKTRGADGRLIKVGQVVRRPVVSHPTWGEVPSVFGRVCRVYRRPSVGGARVLVDFRAPTGGLHTAWADTVRHSAASMEDAG